MLTQQEIVQYQQALAQRAVQLANECRNAYEWGQGALDGTTPIYPDSSGGTPLTAAEVQALQQQFAAFGQVTQVLRGQNANPVNVLQKLLPLVLPRLGG